MLGDMTQEILAAYRHRYIARCEGEEVSQEERPCEGSLGTERTQWEMQQRRGALGRSSGAQWDSGTCILNPKHSGVHPGMLSLVAQLGPTTACMMP